MAYACHSKNRLKRVKLATSAAAAAQERSAAGMRGVCEGEGEVPEGGMLH